MATNSERARLFPRGFMAVLAGAATAWALVVVALYIRFLNSPVTRYHVRDGRITDREWGFLDHYLGPILLLAILLAVVTIVVGAVLGNRSREDVGVEPGGGPASASQTADDGAAPTGWYPDPQGRHELRYWNGSEWTDHVSDQGRMSVDTPGRDAASGTSAPSGS